MRVFSNLSQDFGSAGLGLGLFPAPSIRASEPPHHPGIDSRNAERVCCEVLSQPDGNAGPGGFCRARVFPGVALRGRPVWGPEER
jgi:hypothetical protein